MFFTYVQNNSGGFDLGSRFVIVEAETAADANERALTENTGIYFDGVSEGYDCDCCGDRWMAQYSDADADEVPSKWGEPCQPGPDVMIVYKNVTVGGIDDSYLVGNFGFRELAD